jgi:hypothetical protein
MMETKMNDETELRQRLAAIESRLPAAVPPPLPTARRHHFALSAASALALVLVFAATAVAGVAASGILTPHGWPGIENPGQPLAGAQMECMTPPQAAAFLAAHGYTDVIWQVEAGTDRAGTTTLVTVPPDHGYVVPGAVLDDGKLHMVVDQRAGAEPAGVCGAMPMP